MCNTNKSDLIVDDIVDIVVNITKEEIEKYINFNTKKMIVDYVEKYFED